MTNEILNKINQKNQQNLIKLKITPNLYSFEELLTKIKENKNYKKVLLKKYNKYYDKDYVYILYENGFEKNYKYKDKESSDFIINNKNITLETINIEKLNHLYFEPKFKYDKIKIIEAISFEYDGYEIEFMKIKDNIDYYQVVVNIHKILDPKIIENLFI